MKHPTTLSLVKQSFQQVLPAQDGRCVLSPLEFVTGLVFCFLSDTKSFGLEAIRRFMIGRFEVSISKGAFWERLSGQRLNAQLHALLAQLMARLSAHAVVGEKLLKGLGVSGLYLIDSSSVSLWDGARESHPGTWTPAAIKWHACVDLLSGQTRGFQLSAGSTHDRRCFPPLETVVGKLLLFDLGYWDYGLLLTIDAAKGFFLSRVKVNAGIRIEQVVEGLSPRWVGKTFAEFRPKRKHKALIEVLGRVVHGTQSKRFD